jgi:3',5'-cyclic AMP phosphodiesterase CpdA
VPLAEGEAKVVALDSTKPDLAEGEVGREHYGWLDSELRDWDRGPKIVMVHHHILAVPGTGRDRNNLRDSGGRTARQSSYHARALFSCRLKPCHKKEDGSCHW